MKHSLYKRYKNWQYKNISLLIISLFVLAYVANTSFGHELINSVLKFGYLGSFISGIFFVSTFTVAPSGVVIFQLAKIYNPIMIALTAGIGAVIGDYIIFRFLKDGVFEEMKPWFNRLGESKIGSLLYTPYFAWLAPVLGALIIASPFPDEIGISLMGISKLKNWQFVLISFVLNSLGILFLVTVAKSV